MISSKVGDGEKLRHGVEPVLSGYQNQKCRMLRGGPLGGKKTYSGTNHAGLTTFREQITLTLLCPIKRRQWHDNSAETPTAPDAPRAAPAPGLAGTVNSFLRSRIAMAPSRVPFTLLEVIPFRESNKAPVKPCPRVHKTFFLSAALLIMSPLCGYIFSPWVAYTRGQQLRGGLHLRQQNCGAPLKL